LIDGEHFVTPAPSRKHQLVSASLPYFLFGYLRQNPIDHVFPSASAGDLLEMPLLPGLEIPLAEVFG
jgi:hypothetical protein